MSTITYKNQPGIHRKRGAVPMEGTDYPYTVSKLLWPGAVEAWIDERLLGKSLHVCAGMSQLGDFKVDLFQADPDVTADAVSLPFSDRQFDTVLCDPPYNGKFQWNHDLLAELARVARSRIIFQHWFLPFDRYGRYKKDHRFTMTELALWPPKSYFGRVQVISVLDAKP
jgi:hypothetical protein